jgi:hypothetical protein
MRACLVIFQNVFFHNQEKMRAWVFLIYKIKKKYIKIAPKNYYFYLINYGSKLFFIFS